MNDQLHGSDQVPKATIGGIDVACISLADLIQLMHREAPKIRRSGGAPKLVFDCNGHGISLFATSPDFRNAMLRSDLIHADGGIVVGASRLPGITPIPGRSATTDLFIDALESAARSGCRYYLLGGQADVVEACVETVRDTQPGIQIAGHRNGYFTLEDEEAIIADINLADVDVLWVGLGKPKEQTFCTRHRERLKVGWIVTCGGLFNYITGGYPRAPLWMQRNGLEWLHRMATNPRHLFWRYATTNPHALWLIFKSWVKTLRQ